MSVPEPLSPLAPRRNSMVPGQIYALVLVVLIHALVQALRRMLTPEFPAGAPLTLLAGILLESIFTWGFLRFTLDFSPQRQWLWPGPLRSAKGAALGVGSGVAFFLLLLVLDRIFLHLPERHVTGISFFRQGLIVPAVEEIYFRLLLTGALLQHRWKTSAAVIASSLIFAQSHDYFVAPFLFPVGLAAGWLFARYGLLASFTMHVVYNTLILMAAIL